MFSGEAVSCGQDNPADSLQPVNKNTTHIRKHPAAILGGRALAVLPVRRNHFDPAKSESLIERITIIGTIPHKSLNSSTGDNFIERFFDKGDFMWPSRIRVLMQQYLR